jgi:hypothetical protein
VFLDIASDQNAGRQKPDALRVTLDRKRAKEKDGENPPL